MVRPELIPPPFDKQKFQILYQLANRIASCVPEQDALIEQFNSMIEVPWSREEFGDYPEEESILEAMLPPSILIRDLTAEEIKWLMSNVLEADGKFEDSSKDYKWEIRWWHAILKRSFLSDYCSDDSDDDIEESLQKHWETKQRILDWEKETGKVWGVDF
jgi:hypothetical protein